MVQNSKRLGKGVTRFAHFSLSVMDTQVAIGKPGFWSFPRLPILLFPLMIVTFILDRLRIHPDIAVSFSRPLHMIILFVMVISLLMRGRIRVCSLTPPVLFLLTFNAALFISLVFSYDFPISTSATLSLAQQSLSGLLVGVFLINFWNMQYMNLLARMLCLVTVCSGLTIITDYLGLTSFKSLYLDQEIGRQIGILGEPNFAAGKLAIGFPFIVWAFLEATISRRVLSSILYAIVCVIIILAIFTTGSRMGIFMIGCLLILISIKERKRLLHPKIVTINVLLAVVFLSLLTGPFADAIRLLAERLMPIFFAIGGQELSELSAVKRLEYFITGLDIFLDHPMFGIGLDGYRLIFPLYNSRFPTSWAHNTFIEVLVGTGLVGFISFFALMVSIFTRFLGWQRGDKGNRLSFYFTLSLVMLIIHLFFLSDWPNRYLWNFFIPLSIYLEWFNKRRAMKEGLCKFQ